MLAVTEGKRDIPGWVRHKNSVRVFIPNVLRLASCSFALPKTPLAVHSVNVFAQFIQSSGDSDNLNKYDAACGERAFLQCDTEYAKRPEGL